MLVRGSRLLSDARARGHAVPAFTAYTLEGIRAICLAAERVGEPVLVIAGSSSHREVGHAPLAAAALAAAHTANARIGVHLDHSTNAAEIDASIRLGYTSVMYDGSSLPFGENVTRTRAIVERAHAAGVWVEGELGALTGEEDASSDASAGDVTDPDAAAEYVALTGVDALAPAVGTVHGFTTAPVHVDLDRLRAIAAATDVPLVLHGASGLSDADLRGAIDAGVAKINFNAELRRAQLGALRDALSRPGDDVGLVQHAVVEAIAAVAEARLRLLCGR